VRRRRRTARDALLMDRVWIGDMKFDFKTQAPCASGIHLIKLNTYGPLRFINFEVTFQCGNESRSIQTKVLSPAVLPEPKL
jgi:hypothetical protein